MGGAVDAVSAWGNAEWSDLTSGDPLKMLSAGTFLSGSGAAYDVLSGGKASRDNAQKLVNEQKALDAKRYAANVALATKQSALQKETAQGQYDLAVANENTKFQTDDQAQLDAITKSINDPSLGLDQKLALIDSQVKAGLGTESAKLALNAKTLAQQEFDLYGAGGTRDIQQKQLDSQTQAGRTNILALQQQRDASIAQGENVNTALGLSGAGTDRQVSAVSAAGNQQIQQQALSAGYLIDESSQSQASASVFDQALAKSLAGRNLNQDQFQANFRDAALGLDTSKQSFGLDVTGLGAADAAFRSSADFGLKTNVDNANLGLEGAISGADFSFQQSEINTQGQQYKIDATSNLTMNFLLGVSQVALFASNPAVGAAVSGLGNWWGNTFKSQPSASSNEGGAGSGNNTYW